MIFLPGGIGTIDEVLTSIETKRNFQHNKPIIIVNINNYFEHLFNMFAKIYAEGFADYKNSELYFVANTLEETLNYLTALINNN